MLVTAALLSIHNLLEKKTENQAEPQDDEDFIILKYMQLFLLCRILICTAISIST
jgi:hypothetical protein